MNLKCSGVKNAEDVAKGIEGWYIDIHDYWCSQQFIVPEEIDQAIGVDNHVAQIKPYMWANGWGNGNINQIVDVAPNETYTLTALVKGGIREKEGTLVGSMFIEEMQNREKRVKVDIARRFMGNVFLGLYHLARLQTNPRGFPNGKWKMGRAPQPLEVDNVKLTGVSRQYTPKIGFTQSGRSSGILHIRHHEGLRTGIS